LARAVTPGFIERSLFAFTVILTIAAVFALMPSGATMPVSVVALSIVAAWLITVLAHESGHVLVGNLVGFRLREVAVGPVRLMWNGRSFHLGRNRRNPLAGYSVSLPTGGEHIARRLALTTFGGPAGNLVLGVVAWLLLLAITDGHPHGTAASPVEYFLSALAVFSFIYVPANLLPFRGSARGFVPDGRQIITYLRRNPDRPRQEALALLNAQDQILGRSPETWDEKAIEAALTPRDGSPAEMSALYFAYLHARESGRLERAEHYLDDLIAWRGNHPESHWSTPYVLKTVSAAERGDVAAAREWQQRAGPRLETEDRHLMEGAILRAEGDGTGAARELDLALIELQRTRERLGAWGSTRSMERRVLQMRSAIKTGLDLSC
jgi:hypothetical protein